MLEREGKQDINEFGFKPPNKKLGLWLNDPLGEIRRRIA